MSLETATVRKRKRIVEYKIGGFETAQRAIVFGNTCNALVERDIKPIKFRSWYQGMDVGIVVPESYVGKTRIKLTWLEADQDAAHAIMKIVRKAIKVHENEHGDALSIDEEILRGKPLPQSINMNETLHISIGG